MANSLHIVSLDVPYPADYGGAIDIYYRIKALHSLGLQLTIHVFEYGRGKQAQLEQFGKVIYYKRKTGLLTQFSSTPYIVQSRKNKFLLENLTKDEAPILFEGIHTCGFIDHPLLSSRKKFVRMHNIEHEYYRGLMKNSRFWKKLFFKVEAYKLERFQEKLKFASHIFAIKESDANMLKKINKNTSVLTASIPDFKSEYSNVQRYALFHGNLSVAENEKAALWLIDTLDSVITHDFEFIIAGKNPTQRLKTASKKQHIKLIENPSDKEMDSLVRDAQIHVLFSDVASGVKLKLLACLHSSGFILLNEKMLGNPDFGDYCVVANNAKTFKLHFIGLQNKMLTKAEFDQRQAFLKVNYDNGVNLTSMYEMVVNS